MNMMKNECYQVEITGMTSEGNGVARLDGYVIFVPETAVGDILMVRLIKVLKNYGYGKIEKMITPSKSRVVSDCSVDKQCGGCTYRHINYQAELELKQEFVSDSFKRIGGIDLPVDDIIGSQRESAYRNKAQFPVGKDANGKIVSGFFAKRSHHIISCDECKLQADDFAQIQALVLAFLNEKQISIYDEKSGKGLVRHIYIRKAEVTGEMMVCLVAMRFMIPHMEQLIETLVRANANIKSVIVNLNDKTTNVILGNQCKTVYGSDTITDFICGIKIMISPLSFYQVNRQQAEVLYETAIKQANLSKTDTLIDLYCGTGTIGLICASQVKQVIGIEIIPQAIENAKANAVANKIDHVRFICDDAKNATAQLVLEGIKPDVVIVDPPRKGLDIEVIEAIVAMSPSRLVMVSCNPATAARDASLLKENGYEVKSITPVDMFPRTPHVECVVLMSRATSE